MTRSIAVRTTVAVIVVLAITPLGIYVWNNRTLPFLPTERGRALRTAHRIAATNSRPDQQPSVINVGGWPSSVTKVTIASSTSDQVAAHLNEASDEIGDVTVVQLIGDFQAVHSAPPGVGAEPTTVITIVLDSSGEIREIAYADDPHPRPLARSSVVYQR